MGARSVLRRYSDAWFSAAARRKAGATEVRYPRRRRALMPIRWYHGTFTLTGRTLRLPTARGCPPLLVRLDRPVPYLPGTVRSVKLLFADGRLCIDVTAELPVTSYPAGHAPDPQRVAGVDLGIIHPFAVAGPGGQALLVSGRAIRAEHRLHLADTKRRQRATADRAPSRGQHGSRRWRKTRRRARLVEGRQRRRVRQALHEAAKTVIDWAVQQRIGTLTVGDPRGVLNQPAGRKHNLRLRQWQIGRTLQILHDKATLAGIRVHLVDERGTSSTCPQCKKRIPKPAGRTMSCRHCQFAGHRDLAAAFTIATRTPGGAPTTPAHMPGGVVTHRRAGRHLPRVATARRDPRRRPPRTATAGSLGQRRPAPSRGVARPQFGARIHDATGPTR
ncbi:RNA-guided endonuclease InsQ/TnpB family protein [Paractinoplanes globisporus]|uniref:RNA-guided endonuclease InsQ/TnpB family protein n=2 Tax=Paractinoplanes globisporus TaxID=113565 RepID=A0ABW6WL23_9ACTN